MGFRRHIGNDFSCLRNKQMKGMTELKAEELLAFGGGVIPAVVDASLVSSANSVAGIPLAVLAMKAKQT